MFKIFRNIINKEISFYKIKIKSNKWKKNSLFFLRMKKIKKLNLTTT